jgi:AcrR family transcriptional regulator
MSGVLSHLMPHQIAPDRRAPEQLAADTRDRLLDATLTCIARVGLAKTTLDDVAREARCARATLYRYFPGKQPLVNAAVAREAKRLSDALVAVTADCLTLEDAVVNAITAAVDALEHHAALQYVLLVEQEVLLPHLAFHRADDFLRDASALVAPALEPFLAAEGVERAAEWLVRIVLSYACSPSPAVDLHDAGSVRSLVSDFVLPGLVPTTNNTQGVPS